MELLGLPLDIFKYMVEQMALSLEVREMLQLRLINRLFDQEALRVVFETEFDGDCPSYKAYDMSTSLISRFLQDRVKSDRPNKHPLFRTIDATAKFLSNTSFSAAQEDPSVSIETLCTVLADYLEAFKVCRILGSVSNIEEESPYEAASLIAAAALVGDNLILEKILSKTNNANVESRYFGFPLAAAAFQGNKDNVMLLLRKGADVNSSSTNNPSVLEAVSRAGHVHLLGFLFEPEVGLQLRLHECKTALVRAVNNRHEKVVQLLLEKAQNEDLASLRSQALYEAAWRPHLGIAQMMIDDGVDINMRGDPHKRNVAIVIAAERGNDAITRLLLDNGPDRGDVSEAFYKAARYDHIEIVTMMYEHANTSISTFDVGQAFVNATGNQNTDIMRYLLEKGAELNNLHCCGQTALYCAAVYGNILAIELLVTELNVDINSGPVYQNPLEAAEQFGHHLVAKRLRELGAIELE